jgi:excisionase family DNA binding protein
VAYLSGQEVASLLHVSRATVSRWARAGQLPCVRTLGGHRRYSAESVIEIATELGWPMDQSDLEQSWS